MAIAAWVKPSSPGKFRAPMDGDWVFPAPFAALLPIDPDAPAGPQVDLSDLADGGLVFLVPTGQLAAPFAADRIERVVDGLPSPADRVAHLFGHRPDLPDMLTIAVGDPAVSLTDVLTGEGLGDLDLAAVAILAVPLWALPADQRATVAGLCEHFYAIKLAFAHHHPSHAKTPSIDFDGLVTFLNCTGVTLSLCRYIRMTFIKLFVLL